MTLRRTRQAVSDISDIFFSGFETFGLRQADRYANGLEATLDRIAAQSRMARERSEFTPPVRLEPYRSHVIFYVISPDETVLVIRILHARQDWAGVLF